MTSLYFVRHAQPIHSHEDDGTRPLTQEGVSDSKAVYEALLNTRLDYAVSSPYVRSFDTIKKTAISHKLEITTDERLRERKNGREGNEQGMFQKRWGDLNFCEADGESIGMVQKRNIEAVLELLQTHKDENILIGTHGTALSSILHYYDNSFNCDSFLRIIDFMPYIVRLDFDDMQYIGKEELLIIKKEYSRNDRADKKRL